jgi:predicted ATPase
MVTMSAKMYNRSEDTAKLVDAYERREERHLVLLVGQPGNGKTALAQTLKSRVEDDQGFFISGRFDTLEHPEPFAPFIEAATQYLQAVLQRGQAQGQQGSSNVARVKNALARVMDMSELQAFSTVIPAVGQLFQFGLNRAEDGSSILSISKTTTGTAPNDSNSRVPSGRSSFLVTFCNFMRAISDPKHPIVFFLDDLQSSDAGSLEVLKVLIADKKIQGILCMAAFRPVGVKHPFSLLLRTLESGGVTFVPILPSPLDANSVYEMMQVEYHIGLDEPQLEPISTLIAEETKGNALAIILCLQIMKMKRTGETPFLQAGGGDVKALFKVFYVMLSATCQKVCCVASCMGMTVDAERLGKIMTDDISEAIVEAEQAGILVHHRPISLQPNEETVLNSALKDCVITDPRPDFLHNGNYVFANSTYRDCFYSMITSEDRKIQHSAIGNIYRLDVGKVGIYRVVAHMKIGIELLSPKGREALAQLCLQAGEHNSRWTEFNAAAKYLDLGIKLLDEKKHWKTQFALALALYSASADVYNCMGKYTEMDRRLMEVLQNTKDSMDKLRAYTIQMQSLSSRTMHVDAISLGLKVLPKLGEPVATRRTKAIVDAELKAVKKLLETRSEEDILQGNVMTDRKKLGAMNILNLLMASSFLGQGDMVPLVACRMVRVSLQNGITGSSAVGFSVFGAALCGEGDVELGAWCSNLALKILDRLEEKSCKGRVMAIHWGILSRYQKSWKQCQEPLKVAYRLCIEGGDNEVCLLFVVLSVVVLAAAGAGLCRWRIDPK